LYEVRSAFFEAPVSIPVQESPPKNTWQEGSRRNSEDNQQVFSKPLKSHLLACNAAQNKAYHLFNRRSRRVTRTRKGQRSKRRERAGEPVMR
jgi:hypothetical protein